MWDVAVTKQKGLHKGKPFYTVVKDFIASNGKLPKTVVLLDAPNEGQYIEFGNCENDTYYSSSYEYCLAVVKDIG